MSVDCRGMSGSVAGEIVGRGRARSKSRNDAKTSGSHKRCKSSASLRQRKPAGKRPANVHGRGSVCVLAHQTKEPMKANQQGLIAKLMRENELMRNSLKMHGKENTKRNAIKGISGEIQEINGKIRALNARLLESDIK